MTNNIEKNNKTKQNAPKIPVPDCGYYLGTIYFYLTEGCNLKCRHCWINPPFEAGEKKNILSWILNFLKI